MIYPWEAIFFSVYLLLLLLSTEATIVLSFLAQ